MASILIVEDEIDHQHYLNTVIDSHSGFKNLGVIKFGRDAIKYISENRPDVVLIDIGLPDISGIDCIASLTPLYPKIKFLVCTIHEEDENVFDALKAGASGYILKKSKPYQIIDAIKEIHKGETPISPAIASKILNLLNLKKEPTETNPEQYKMTPKQIEILNELSKGSSYIEIADALFISIKTLKWHINKIYKKLHASNRTEALNAYFKTKDE